MFLVVEYFFKRFVPSALHSGLTKLRELNLSGGVACNEGITHLLTLTNLKSLAFDYCHGVTDEGLQQLCALAGLESLSMTDCSISDAGVC